MINKVYKSGNLTLFYADSLSWKKKSEFQLLSRYLGVSLEVMEGFVSGRGRDDLALKAQLEVQLTLCGDGKIRSLNRLYRNKDKATDVLSFPVHDSLRRGERESTVLFDVLNIGDIVISRDTARRQADSFQISFPSEIVHLFVHGFLHLCGFDHEVSKGEEKIMFDLEDKLVEKIYKKLGLKGKV